MTDLRKVEIGFDGGQVLPIAMPEQALEGLREALGGDGWHRIETEEGAADVALAKVAFVRTVGGEHKVGF